MKQFTHLYTKILCLLALLTIGVNYTWALDEYVTVTDFNGSTTFSGNNLNHVNNGTWSNSANRVNFSISGINRYDDERLVYADQAKNTTEYSNFSWAVNDAKYSVSVSGIEAQVRAWSLVNYSATAWFDNNSSVDCGTNSTGKGGAKKVTATAGLSGSRIRLAMRNNSSSWWGGTVAFTLHDIKFTYKVTHKEYLYGFAAVAVSNNIDYGTTTASVANSTIQAAVGVYEASTTATYTASPKEGYQFLGWFENSAMTGEPISTAYTYEKTLTNNTAGSVVTGTLYAKFAEKYDQTIIWNLEPGLEYPTGTLMDATATSGLQVTYSSSNRDYGYINENNRLVVVVPNQTITITASQDGNDHYKPAPDVEKIIITLGANPNQHEDVHADSITYGDLLGASRLSGKVYLDEVEIAGTLSWVDPMIMPVAGTANHMVLFTPTNTAAYSSVYFEVPVTVGKANPVITWNISSALRENTIYKNIAVSSNREETLTLTETSDYLSISGLVLTIGEIGETEKSNITITAHQEESANYKEVTSIQTITIYPKVVQCVPAYVNSEKVLDNMGAKYVAPSGWCTTTETVHGKYEVFGVSWLSFDVQYPQYEGIQLGSWSQGLNSLGTDFWTNLASSLSSLELEGTDKDIVLKFTGIPDSLFFDTKLQTVSFKLINWTPAKQKNPVWTVYERTIDGTERQIEGSYDAYNTSSIKLPLDSTTRSVRIQIHSAFAGFIQNLRITQKRYIRADKESLVFGTDSKPLQEPQTLTLSYSSLGDCAGTDDKITVTSSNPAFYVDETTITENVGIEQMGSYTIRVRCNDVNQSGKITFESNDGTQLEVPVSSTKPTISALTAGTAIFQTGTERAPYGSTPYRALRTHNFFACFDADENALFDALYIYGVSESSAANRQWSYDASKGYNVPTISASNVHTPCFVYKKDGKQYTYDHTFDASTETLNIADGKKHIFVGYKPECSAATAIQVNGANTELYLNNTEIIASGAPLAINATSAVYANRVNIISSTDNAAVQLSGATTLTVEDTWTGDATSAILALRPAASYPSIDLGSASGRVDVNGTQLTLRNATNMAIAHMEGTTEHFDGEVHINDGSIGGEATLGMPKRTFIDGGTFNDGTVAAYTLKGMPKRPRNSRGDMLSRHTMSKDALASAYSWYGQAHLTQDGASKVNPMLMDEVVWIFTGDAGESYDEADSWNKDGVPGENDDVLINAPMVISGGEKKLHGITINWVDGEHGIPAVTVAYNGGLTVGEDGVDGATKGNLALKADSVHDSATKGQTGFLRIHPNSAEPMPEATVELFSIGYYDMNSDEENIAAWQYVGIPVATNSLASTFFYYSWIYSWIEEGGEWQNNRAILVMDPFEGYATTQFFQKDGLLVSFTGQVTAGEEYESSVTAKGITDEKGCNLLANSFTAPIDIAKFDSLDFSDGVEPTIYLFNTGSRKDAETKSVAEVEDSTRIPGQYVHIPVFNIEPLKSVYKGLPTTIAPMQGFCVKTTKTGTVKFNYERLVWGADYKEHPNTPLHMPRKAVNTSTLGSLCISISANGWRDNLYMLESESYDKTYEAGYDAPKMNSGNFNIFAVEGDQQLAVDATNNMVGTHIGVRAGEETTYTMSFSHMKSEHELLFFDSETNEVIDIYDGLEYTFNVEPNTTITDRFIIMEREKTPEVTTAIEKAAANSIKVKKFIKDNQLYILKNGVLYNATGARVH